MSHCLEFNHLARFLYPQTLLETYLPCITCHSRLRRKTCKHLRSIHFHSACYGNTTCTNQATALSQAFHSHASQALASFVYMRASSTYSYLYRLIMQPAVSRYFDPQTMSTAPSTLSTYTQMRTQSPDGHHEWLAKHPGSQIISQEDLLEYASPSKYPHLSVVKRLYGQENLPSVVYTQISQTTDQAIPTTFHRSTLQQIQGEFNDIATSSVTASDDLSSWVTGAYHTTVPGKPTARLPYPYTEYDGYSLFMGSESNNSAMEPFWEDFHQRATAATKFPDEDYSFAAAPKLQYQNQTPSLSLLSNDLSFTSLSQAVKAISPPDWYPPSFDLTIPTTDIQRQQWILQLLNAINNTDNVCDARTLTFQRRWYSPTTGRSRYYSARDKEILSWDILSLAESLHREGPSALLSFDKVFWTNAAKTKDWTFAERMDCIVKVLTSSKARCEKLLAGLGLQNLVANPLKLIKTTKGNGKQNGKRQRLLVVGRAVKKRKTDDSGVENSISP